MSTIEEEFANLAPPENFDWDESALGNDVDLPPELRPLSPSNESETPGLSTSQGEAKVDVEKDETPILLEQTELKEETIVENNNNETTTKNPEDDEEKRKQRALRFGIPLSDKDKATQRAKRFGIPMSQTAPEPKKQKNAKAANPTKLELPSDKIEEIERAIKRAERFGIPLSDEQKAAKRALRFGLPVPEEVVKKNPVANKQKAKQPNPKNKQATEVKKPKNNSNKTASNAKSSNQKNVQTNKPNQKNTKKPQNTPQKAKTISSVDEEALKRRQARFGPVDTKQGQTPQMKKKRTGRFSGNNNNKNKKAKST